MLPAWKNSYPLTIQLNLNDALKRIDKSKEKQSKLAIFSKQTLLAQIACKEFESLEIYPSVPKQFVTFTNLCLQLFITIKTKLRGKAFPNNWSHLLIYAPSRSYLSQSKHCWDENHFISKIIAARHIPNITKIDVAYSLNFTLCFAALTLSTCFWKGS